MQNIAVHTIPLGALVEINLQGSGANGARLFVVAHHRGFDQTPLYTLSQSFVGYESLRLDSENPEFHENARAWYKSHLQSISTDGYAEQSLKVIRLPWKAGQLATWKHPASGTEWDVVLDRLDAETAIVDLSDTTQPGAAMQAGLSPTMMAHYSELSNVRDRK